MTKLPQKDLLSGSKTPRTTTGEMKNALGKLRDFLSELFGEDSSDKEAVRKTLGIDLTELTNKIEAKAVSKRFKRLFKTRLTRQNWKTGRLNWSRKSLKEGLRQERLNILRRLCHRLAIL